MNNIFAVYSQRLAGFLMMNGFPLLQIVKNQKTGKNDFLFPNNERLQDCIDKWQIERLTQNNKD